MRYFTSLVTLALALSFAACSQDAVEEAVPEAPGNVHITLSAPFNAPESRDLQAGYTAEVDKTRELIESYYVVFTQGDGLAEHVVKVVKDADVRVDDTGKKNPIASENIYGVESKRLDIELRPGTYKVYAFANLPESEVSGLTYKASDLHNLAYKIPDAIMKSGRSFKDKPFVPCDDVEMVPMSNTILEDGGGNAVPQTITVTERTSQKFGIELVRMLGKVQFDFRNPTGKDLQINRIKMSDLTVNSSTAGSLMLMNYLPLYSNHTDYLSKGIALPGGTSTASLNADYTGSPLDLNANSDPEHYSKTNDGTATASFYVLESKSRVAVGNSFDLDFDITPAAPGTYPDSLRFAITKPDNFTTIHRNDWIVIPIAIGEWTLSLTAFSYPPIGGYPSARVSADKSGNFHIAFATPGDISFLPVIHKYYSTTDYFYLNDATRIVSSSLTVNPAWDDASSILSTEPTVDPFTGAIETSLKPEKGTTTLTLSVTFKKTLSPETLETLISKIVIERI